MGTTDKDKELANRRRVVEAFVLRARRVAAHSLPSEEPELLRRLASGEFKVQIAPDGTTSMHHVVPNEEAFESLASRLRPFDLDSESIHFPKVIKRLQAHVAEQPAEEVHVVDQQLSAIKDDWDSLTTETGDRLFPRTERAKLSHPTEMSSVPMRTLAAGWMYRDLTHYDLKKDRQIAGEFPIRERYLSAIHYYSGMALIVLDLLGLVRNLTTKSWLDLSSPCWTEDVVAGEEVLHSNVQIFVAPADDAPPVSIPALISGDAPGSWTELTTMKPAGNDRRDFPDIAIDVLDQADVTVSNVRLKIVEVIHGQIGNGLRVVANSQGGLLQIDLRTSSSVADAHFDFQIAVIPGSKPAAILREIETVKALSKPHTLRLSVASTGAPLASAAADHQVDVPPLIEQVATDLDHLQHHTTQQLKMPDLASVSNAEIEHLNRVADVYRGIPWESTWKHMALTRTDGPILTPEQWEAGRALVKIQQPVLELGDDTWVITRPIAESYHSVIPARKIPRGGLNPGDTMELVPQDSDKCHREHD